MDRGAFWATVHGSQRVGHDWVTNTFSLKYKDYDESMANRLITSLLFEVSICVCLCVGVLYLHVHNFSKEIDTELLKGITNWKHLFCSPKLFPPTTFFPTPKWKSFRLSVVYAQLIPKPTCERESAGILEKLFTCNTSWSLHIFKIVEDVIQLFSSNCF